MAAAAPLNARHLVIDTAYEEDQMDKEMNAAFHKSMPKVSLILENMMNVILMCVASRFRTSNGTRGEGTVSLASSRISTLTETAQERFGPYGRWSW